MTTIYVYMRIILLLKHKMPLEDIRFANRKTLDVKNDGFNLHGHLM